MVLKGQIDAFSQRFLQGAIYLTEAFPVVLGHDIELECTANGPAPPVLHWLYNGRHVEQVRLSPQI